MVQVLCIDPHLWIVESGPHSECVVEQCAKWVKEHLGEVSTRLEWRNNIIDPEWWICCQMYSESDVRYFQMVWG